MTDNTILLNVQVNHDDATKDLNKIDSGVDKIKDSTKELSQEAKKTGVNWTELSSKINVFKEAFSAVVGIAQKFNEIQTKGRKENIQWESMMNSTKAKEISESYAKIDKAYADNIDKATKMRMAYSAGLSDIEYDIEGFSNIVQNMAQRTGKDIQEVAEELQQGFLKGDLGMLEDNGIMHNAELELQKYAGSIGKTADELTDFEKRQANTTILQKYLNAEFNNTKPIQDAYLDLTNKASHATEGFSAKIAELTDNVFDLNNGFKNLSVGKQMANIAQEIKDAEQALWKQGSLSVDIDKDLANIESKKSKLLSLQGESANILTSRLVNQMGVRRATSKQEISKIIKDIDKEIESTNERLKGFIANGKMTMTEETSKLMIQIEALKSARNEALKEGSALGNIKEKKGTAAKVDPVKSIVESMKNSSEEAKTVYSDALKAMTDFNKGVTESTKLTKEEELSQILADDKLKYEIIKMNMDNEAKIIEDGLQNQRKIMEKDAAEKEKIQDMGNAVFTAAANSVYNDLISGQEDFLQRAAAVALSTAGSQIFADGLKNVWIGGGQMIVTGGLKGGETVAYGVAEMGVGIGLGYMGNQIMPDAASKEGASATEKNKTDSNNYTFNIQASLYGNKKQAQKELSEVMR